MPNILAELRRPPISLLLGHVEGIVAASWLERPLEDHLPGFEVDDRPTVPVGPSIRLRMLYREQLPLFVVAVDQILPEARGFLLEDTPALLCRIHCLRIDALKVVVSGDCGTDLCTDAIQNFLRWGREDHFHLPDEALPDAAELLKGKGLSFELSKGEAALELPEKRMGEDLSKGSHDGLHRLRLPGNPDPILPEAIMDGDILRSFHRREAKGLQDRGRIHDGPAQVPEEAGEGTGIDPADPDPDAGERLCLHVRSPKSPCQNPFQDFGGDPDTKKTTTLPPAVLRPGKECGEAPAKSHHLGRYSTGSRPRAKGGDSMREVVILEATRTPIGRFLGGLSTIPAPRLGSIVIREALRRAGIEGAQVDGVIMGNVLSAGLGQAPARQAALHAGLPEKVGAVTVNKMCGSGLQAVIFAAQAIALGDAEVIVAGGMENMSAAPYILEQARTGYRLGDGKLVDTMLRDGLVDAYRQIHMGNCAEILAREYRISREEQDEYAKLSYSRALHAMDNGLFQKEIVPVEIPQKKGEPLRVVEDEEPRRVDFAKMATLPPAFEEGGTVTAANASSISDGASAVVVASGEFAKAQDRTPLGRIVGYAGAALAPEWFTIAPAHAIQNLLRKIRWRIEDVDLFEINEAFAAVIIGVCRELGLDYERVNVHGGAVALGHPIGASGARILTTLLYAMEARKAKRGVAAICLAGGEALALAVER